MRKILLSLLSVVLLASAADAKWWIFGKGGGDIGLRYLTIAGISAEEAGPKITLYTESLGPDGLVRIQGRAQAGKNRVGSVRISLDDKATWQEAKLSDNGTFEYSFRPEEGKKYVFLVEVTDTAGKMNKTDETRRELTLSADKMRDKITGALDAMFDAYSKERLPEFMARVGDDFAGDKVLLERAVRKDFDALSGINMRYTVNNITSGASGKVFVSITFNRMVVINKTGASNTDTGTTEFVFSLKEGKPVLYSMKQPLMFGLSDAENVASGTVLGNETTPLTLNESGAAGAARQYTKTNSGATVCLSYSFADGSVSNESNLPCDESLLNQGDIAFAVGHIAPSTPNGTKVKFLGGRTVDSVSSADILSPAGYQTTIITEDLVPGNTFGVMADGRYYAIEFLSFVPNDNSTPFTVTFKVRSF